MCAICGCSDGSKATVINLQTGEGMDAWYNWLESHSKRVSEQAFA